MNEAIRASAYRAARGEIRGLPTAAFYCLKLARLIVEDALFEGRVEFYDRYLVARTTQGHEKRDDWTPWAADAEASMKKLGFAVPFSDRQAGDLVFNYRAARPYGHVGVLIEPNLVLENIRPEYRPRSIHIAGKHFLSLTPLEHFEHTLVARLQPRESR